VILFEPPFPIKDDYHSHKQNDYDNHDNTKKHNNKKHKRPFHLGVKRAASQQRINRHIKKKRQKEAATTTTQ